MNKSLIFAFISMCVLLTNCNQSNVDKKYFNGEIHLINDLTQVEKLEATEFDIEGVYNGHIVVYDSLLFYYPLQQLTTKHFYEIYNLKNDSLLGNFCFRGRGPDETVGIAPICNLYSDKGSLKTLLYAANEKRLIEWNISKSLVTNTTVNDTIIPYTWMVDNHTAIYNRIFHLNDTAIFVEAPPRYTDDSWEKVSLPVYEKRTIFTNKKLRSYPVFIDTPKSEESKSFSHESILYTYSCVKPDSKKIAQSVMYLQQINIIDLETGDVKGFRIKGTPGFSIFEKDINKVKTNYSSLEADNNYIYALYREVSAHISDTTTTSQLHIFNWNGNLIRKYDLGQIVKLITLDPVNNILYGRNNATEKMYRYDLNKKQINI